MTKKTVQVELDERPISYLDHSGKEVSLGTLSSRSYLGENLTRYMLQREGREDQASEVGTGRHELGSFLNHADAQRPMFDLGFKLADITIGRGGTDIYSLWEYPDGTFPTIKDPIDWDKDSWGKERKRMAGEPLRPGVIMQGTIRSGRGLTWSSAVLRLICTNGLTRWEGSGQLHKANGNNFEPASLAEVLFKVPEASSTVLGREIGNKHGVERTISLLHNFFGEDIDPEARKRMIAETPAVLVDTVTAIDRAPTWLTMGMIDQLSLFNAHARRPKMTELDVQNVVTNAINMPRFGPRDPEVEAANHSASRAFRMSSSLTQSVSDLVGIFSLAG